MAIHNEIGAQGEKLAAKFLIKKGYRILVQNYRFKHLEIDLICEFERELIIIEVKTRSNQIFQRPELSVNRTKQRQLIKATNQFITENQIDLETRFDVIGITLNNATPDINHIQDAFSPLL